MESASIQLLALVTWISLTLVIRYVLENGNVVEQFLQFLPIEYHNGKYLFNLAVNILKLRGIDITNCRSQSYDNAGNMSGIYYGVQARFREINNLRNGGHALPTA